MGRAVALRGLADVMVTTLTWNAKDTGLIPTVGSVFPIVITPKMLQLHMF